MTRSKKYKKSKNNHQNNLSQVKTNEDKLIDENIDLVNKQQKINNKILPSKICLSCGVLSSRKIPHKCLATNQICLKCNKKGHYSHVCQFSEKQDDDDDDDDDDSDDIDNAYYTDDINEKYLLKENKIIDNDKIINANIRINEMKEEANCLYKEKNFKDALKLYTKIIAECSNDEFHYENRAACFMMIENYKDALVDAKKSIEINPKFVKGHVCIIKCLMILGKFNEAKIALNKLYNINPTNDTVIIEKKNLFKVQKYNEIINKSMANKNYKLALDNINEILKISIESVDHIIKKCECLAYIGDYIQAENIIKKILITDKMNIDAKFVLCLCYYYQNVNIAMDILMEVLRIVPEHKKALEIYKKSKTIIGKKNAGNIAFNKYDYEKAHNLYADAIKVDENNIGIAQELYYKMAQASFHLKKYKQSINECDKVLKTAPDNYIEILLHRGESYMKINDYKNAVDDFENALKYNPFSNECRKLLKEAKKLLKSTKSNYYDILGVKNNSSIDDVKKAYREKAMLHHPDRHSNASEEEKLNNEKTFKEITRAYRNLTEKNLTSCDDKDDDEDEDDADYWREFSRKYFDTFVFDFDFFC